ncbi:MAG: guanylate kinase [Chlamydiae bacterium RIFCSPLOWO2_01_FULL_28_7]|nr:MAG: guanylate kinase [Chlamydiae bacterium RIFCSPLOWO2_01_FULL_28_7]
MQKLIGNLKKGLFFILSAPSGGGKTTLIRMLTKEYEKILESVSFTTRETREDEREGIDYFFISKEDFEEKIRSGFFLEYAKVYDNYYGTSKEYVKKHLNEGKHVVLVIDTQGALSLKNKVEASYIFISPPSLEELKMRIIKRDGKDVKDLDKRLKWAEKELKQIPYYDYNITNFDINTSYEVLKSIFISEEHKVKNLGEKA